MSSASNFLTSVAAARLLGVAGFGRFSVLFAGSFVALALARSVIGDPLLALSASLPEAEQSRTVGDALTASAAVGAVVGLGIGLVTGGLVPDGAFVAAACTFAGAAVAVEDTVRYAGFTAFRPKIALLADTVWLLVVALGSAAAWCTGFSPSAPVLLMLWGSGAAIGAVVGFHRLDVDVRRGGTRRWVRRTGHLGKWLAAQTSLSQGVAWIVNIALVYVVGARELGGIRALQSVFAPVALVVMAALGLVTPLLARSFAADPELLRSQVARFGAISFIAALVGAPLLGLAAEPAVRIVFGGEYVPFADLAPAFSAAAGFLAAGAVAGAACRVFSAGRAILAAQAIALMVGTPLILLGGMEWGRVAVAWGYALQSLTLSAVSWLVVASRLR